jgi:hypothetical protein
MAAHVYSIFQTCKKSAFNGNHEIGRFYVEKALAVTEL